MKQARQKGRLRCKPSNTVASFLLKTHEILEHQDYQHIVGWTSDNTSFMIKNVQLFSKEVLPRYFRHSNFTSFVRQLNMYDFHKIKQQGNCVVFRNDLFIRNGKNLLKEIKRKFPKARKYQATERECSSSLKNRHISSLNHSTKQDCQFKRLLQAELNYSSNVFEKAIKILQRTINSKNTLKLLQRQLDSAVNSDTTQSRAISTDSLYQIKSKCYSLLNSYQTVLREINSSYDQKLKSLGPAQQNSKNTKQSVIELEVSKKKNQQTKKSSQGFKPYSLLSLPGKHSAIQQTNVVSIPEFNSQE